MCRIVGQTLRDPIDDSYQYWTNARTHYDCLADRFTDPAVGGDDDPDPCSNQRDIRDGGTHSYAYA